MEYLKNYSTFRNQSSEVANEGIMDVLKAATGAVKNFFSGIAAPFKNFKADFQKGLSLEEAKTKVSKSLDGLLSNAIKSVNGAKEESELVQMKETFVKNIDAQMAEFDKSISTVKESTSINEGKIQDGMIGGRVLFGLLKDEYNRLSIEFEKKFAAAKDLAKKKAEMITFLKNTVEGSKKKIQDAKLIEDKVAEYKEEKKIAESPAGEKGQIVLDWGDVEATIKPSEEKPGFYQVVSTNSKKVAFKEGQKLFVKIPAEIKVGDKVMMTEMERDGKPDPLKQYETGAIEKITQDGKEVPNLKAGEAAGKPEDELKKTLGEIKDPKQMDTINKIVKGVVSKPDKVEEIEKLLA